MTILQGWILCHWFLEWDLQGWMKWKSKAYLFYRFVIWSNHTCRKSIQKFVNFFSWNFGCNFFTNDQRAKFSTLQFDISYTLLYKFETRKEVETYLITKTICAQNNHIWLINIFSEKFTIPDWLYVMQLGYSLYSKDYKRLDLQEEIIQSKNELFSLIKKSPKNLFEENNVFKVLSDKKFKSAYKSTLSIRLATHMMSRTKTD